MALSTVPDLAFNEYSFLSRHAPANPVFLPISKADIASKVRDDVRSQMQSEDASSLEHTSPEGLFELPQPTRHQERYSAPVRGATAAGEGLENSAVSGKGSASHADSDLSEAHSAYSLLQRRQRAAAEEARLHAQAAPIGRAAVGTAPLRSRPPPSLLLSQMQSQQRSPQADCHDRFMKKPDNHPEDDLGTGRDFPGSFQGSPILEETDEALSFVRPTQDQGACAASPYAAGEGQTAFSGREEDEFLEEMPDHQRFDSPRAPPLAKGYPLHSVEVGHDDVCMDGWSGLLTPHNRNNLQSDEEEPFTNETQVSGEHPGVRLGDHDHDTGGDRYPRASWNTFDTGWAYANPDEGSCFSVIPCAGRAAASGRPSYGGPDVSPVGPATAPATPEEREPSYLVSQLLVMRDLARPEENMPRTRLSTFVAAERAERRERPQNVELYKEDKDFQRFWL